MLYKPMLKFIIIISISLSVMSCMARPNPQLMGNPASSLPTWVKNPRYDGYLGAIGIAKRDDNSGYERSRRLAKILAEAELAKQKQILINSICKLEKTAVFSNAVLTRYTSKIQCQSEQIAKAYLKTIVSHEWIDPRTGDLYLRVVIDDKDE